MINVYKELHHNKEREAVEDMSHMLLTNLDDNHGDESKRNENGKNSI